MSENLEFALVTAAAAAIVATISYPLGWTPDWSFFVAYWLGLYMGKLKPFRSAMRQQP
jgi:hypothetical protein